MDYYKIQPRHNSEREGDYIKAESIVKKWEVTKEFSHVQGTCGNVKPYFIKDAFTYTREDPKDWCKYSMSRAISSAFAMYRLAGIFPADSLQVEGSAGYKCVWQLWLIHKETGKALTIYDYKGALSSGTPFYDVSKAPDSYLKDAEELFNFLVSDTIPHPYDGVVSGSIA